MEFFGCTQLDVTEEKTIAWTIYLNPNAIIAVGPVTHTESRAENSPMHIVPNKATIVLSSGVSHIVEGDPKLILESLANFTDSKFSFKASN